MAEYRRPNLKQGLNDLSLHKGEAINLTVIFTADPAPQITWLKDGKPLVSDDHRKVSVNKKELEHGLVEYTCSVQMAASKYKHILRYLHYLLMLNGNGMEYTF